MMMKMMMLDSESRCCGARVRVIRGPCATCLIEASLCPACAHMYVYVYVYVCVYVCMYVWFVSCVPHALHMLECMHVYVYTCVCVYMCLLF
jgi:hypothetical protein